MPSLGRIYMDGLAVEAVSQLPAVRHRLGQVADRIAGEARHIAQQEGMGGVPVNREDGTRPKGRPYARVTVPLPPPYYGWEKLSRLELLAAAVGRL